MRHRKRVDQRNQLPALLGVSGRNQHGSVGHLLMEFAEPLAEPFRRVVVKHDLKVVSMAVEEFIEPDGETAFAFRLGKSEAEPDVAGFPAGELPGGKVRGVAVLSGQLQDLSSGRLLHPVVSPQSAGDRRSVISGKPGQIVNGNRHIIHQTPVSYNTVETHNFPVVRRKIPHGDDPRWI